MKPLLKDVIIPKTIRETDAVIYTRKVFNTGFTPYYEMVLAITKCINGKEVVFVIAGNNAGNVYEQSEFLGNHSQVDYQVLDKKLWNETLENFDSHCKDGRYIKVYEARLKVDSFNIQEYAEFQKEKLLVETTWKEVEEKLNDNDLSM